MNDKLNILCQLLGNFYKEGKEQYLFTCPKCNHHKKKLSINIEKGLFHCWICEFGSSNIRDLFKKYGKCLLNKWDQTTGYVDLSQDNEFEFDKQEEGKTPQFIKLPKEFKTLTSKNLPFSGKIARKYLFDRGLTKIDIIRWKIGYATTGQYKGRILIPSFGENGRVNYFVGRAYENLYPKYLNSPYSRDIVFNELYIDWKSPLIIVEGVFDAIKAGLNSIPILGSFLGIKTNLFEKIVTNKTPVYIALDPDMENKALKLVNNLMKYDISVFKINIDPFKDVGEMPKEEFLKRKQEATNMNENYLLYKVKNL